MRTSLVTGLICGLIAIGLLANYGCRRKPKEQDSVERRQAQQIADRREAMKYVKEDGQVDWRKRVDAASEALEKAKSERRWGRSSKALELALEAAQLMPPPSKDFAMQTPAPPAGDSESDADGETVGQNETGVQQGGEGSSGATPGGGASGGDSTSGAQDGSGGGAEGGGSHGGGEPDGGTDDGTSGGINGGTSGGTDDGTSGGTNDGTSGVTSGGGAERGGGSGGGRSSVADSGPRVTNEEVRQLRASLDDLLESLDGKAGNSRRSVSFERDAIELK